MKLSKLVIEHPRGTLILFISFILFGFAALPFINRDLFPKIEYPVITVITTLNNKSPQEMRNLITVPMEEVLSSTPGLRNMKSVSRYGESQITLTFDWGVNLDLTYMETREKLDYAKSILPQGTSRPIALRFNPNNDPIMTFGVKVINPTITGDERAYITKNVKPLLERIEGVAFIEIVGGSEQEIKVNVSLDKLYANNLSIDEVIKSIEDNNIEYPVGTIEENKTEFTVNISGKLPGYRQLGSLVVGRNEQGVPIYLENIAVIQPEAKEKRVQFRLNGKEGVAIHLYKEGDANIVKTADQIAEKLPFIKEKLKHDLSFQTIYDNSKYVKDSINDITASAIIGILLTLIILFLFLEDMISSLIVGLAIPITIVMTLLFMYLLNISINLISLTGLSIGIGSMVDANIVIIENIKRYKKSAEDQSVLIKAANEVTVPVITAILTNIAVFLPVIFVQGIASSIFRELALVVTFSHLSTLLTSIMLTPALYRLFQDRIEKTSGKVKTSFSSYFERVKGSYLKLLSKVIGRYKLMVAALFVLIVFSCGALILNKKEVLPLLAQNSFTIRVQFDPGFSLDKTESVIAEVEKIIASDRSVNYYYSVIGDDSALSSYTKSKKSHIASVRIFLKKGSNLKEEVKRIGDKTSTYLTGAKLSIEESQTAFSRLFPSDNEIYFLGNPREYLVKIASFTTNLLTGMGISNQSVSTEEETVLSLQFDRASLNNSGMTARSVADMINACIQGKNATRLESADHEEMDVNVKLDQDLFNSPDSLNRILLKPPHGENVRLSTVVSITNEVRSTEINRLNQQEMIFVRFLDKKADLSKIQGAIKNINLARTVNTEFSWDTPEVKKSINSLLLVLLLSIIVIFVIIAFQFESIQKSLLIMLTIPLIFIGLSPVLLLLGVSINIISLVGIILLVGIVVDNAIVMVDFYEKNKQAKLSDEHLKAQIVEGSGVRFRPIIMSSLTTLIGLLPLIFFPGEGMEFQRILAITIASGFFFSTSITLFFLPSIYYWLEKRSK